MQKVAAYLLERRDGIVSSDIRTSEAEAVRSKISAWLQSKGAVLGALSGTYAAEDQSHATFAIEEATDGSKTWWGVRLDELTAEGRQFTARLSVTTTDVSVAVYCTLEAGSDSISPVRFDPKTPRIIRELLAMPGAWHHGSSQLRTLQYLRGLAQGAMLASEILSPHRAVPIIVVTERDGQLALPKLDGHLAHDVAGLANVVCLDSDGTWGLSERLGAGLRCYGGAVRIYWPRLALADDPYRHSLWTAGRLQGVGDDLAQTTERFRRQVRSVVMRASALSVKRPREIDEIRRHASLQAFAEMKARANSLADYQEIADSFARENDRLRTDNAELQLKVENLETQLADLESRKDALLVRIQNVELQLRSREATEFDISPTVDSDSEDVPPPARGEIRFYKKNYATKHHDVMVRVDDCKHNNWQSASKAEKAKKGVSKLENGRSDWQTLQHCQSCQGGGMWRVRW